MRGRCQQEVEGVQRPQGAGQRYFGTAFGAAPRAPMVFEGTRRLLWEANVGSVAGFYRTAGCRPRLRDLKKKKRVCQGGADQYGGWGSLQGRGVRRGVVWRCGVYLFLLWHLIRHARWRLAQLERVKTSNLNSVLVSRLLLGATLTSAALSHLGLNGCRVASPLANGVQPVYPGRAPGVALHSVRAASNAVFCGFFCNSGNTDG